MCLRSRLPEAAVPSSSKRLPSLRLVTEAVLLVALWTLWASLQVHALVDSVNDDGTYFAAAHAVVDGRLPYRDFFFAHPLLHLAPLAVVASVTDSLQALRTVAPAFAAFTFLILWWHTRQRYGRVGAFVALAVGLGSTTLLGWSSQSTGFEVAGLGLIAALVLADRRPAWSGVALGLACGGALFVLVAAPALLWASSHRRAFVVALLATALVVHGLPMLLIPGALEQTLVFHLHKERVPGAWRDLVHLVALDAPLIVAALLTALARRRDAFATTCLMIAASFALALLLLAERHDYYPSLALLACVPLVGRVLGPDAGRRRLAPVVWIAATLLVAPAAWWLVRPAGVTGEVQATWTQSEVAPSLGDLAKPFFSASLPREKLVTGPRRWLFERKRSLASAQGLAAHLRRSMNPRETLTGAARLAPLLSLLSGRDLAAGEVDLNGKVFATGARDERAFWQRACEDGLSVVLAMEQSFVPPDRLASSAWFQQEFQLDRRVVEKRLRPESPVRIEIWRRAGPAPCRGP